MASVTVPGRCNQGGAGGKECKPGSMVIVADACKYYDQQKLKLQESPEVVPTGEMPRNILLTIERCVATPLYACRTQWQFVTYDIQIL